MAGEALPRMSFTATSIRRIDVLMSAPPVGWEMIGVKDSPVSRRARHR
jgi:hypothetical protein